MMILWSIIEACSLSVKAHVGQREPHRIFLALPVQTMSSLLLLLLLLLLGLTVSA